MYVIAVLFELRPAHAHAFCDAVLRNAAASLRDEPGCRRFDVCVADGGARCFLYELYDDRAAFDAHLATPHFTEFSAATEPMVTNKRIDAYELAANPYAAAAAARG